MFEIRLMIILDFSKISITVFFLISRLKLLCIIIQNRKKKISSRVVSKEFLERRSIFNFSNFVTLVMFLLFYETCINYTIIQFLIWNVNFSNIYIDISKKIKLERFYPILFSFKTTNHSTFE